MQICVILLMEQNILYEETKYKQVSFDNLRYVYSSSLALIKAVEDGVKKGLNNSSNEW